MRGLAVGKHTTQGQRCLFFVLVEEVAHLLERFLHRVDLLRADTCEAPVDGKKKQYKVATNAIVKDMDDAAAKTIAKKDNGGQRRNETMRVAHAIILCTHVRRSSAALRPWPPQAAPRRRSRAPQPSSATKPAAQGAKLNRYSSGYSLPFACLNRKLPNGSNLFLEGRCAFLLERDLLLLVVGLLFKHVALLQQLRTHLLHRCLKKGS